MPIVLKGERKIEAGGVTFTLRPERLGDVILGKQAAIAQGLDISNGGLAVLGFSLVPRITAMEGVQLADGTEAQPTPENIGELFESRPQIMMDLIAKAFGDEAPASKNLETSQSGSSQSSQEPVPVAETQPENVE